jgi:hypothetical protein
MSDFNYATTVRRLAGAGVGRAAHLREGLGRGAKGRKRAGGSGGEPQGVAPRRRLSLSKESENFQKVQMVAGAGFEPATSGL